MPNVSWIRWCQEQLAGLGLDLLGARRKVAGGLTPRARRPGLQPRTWKGLLEVCEPRDAARGEGVACHDRRLPGQDHMASPVAIMWAPAQIMWAGSLCQNQ